MGDLQTLDIIENIVGYSINKVGTCLLKDDNGNKIKKLEVDYASVTARVEEMFQLWINGDGKRPVSWEVLIACLESAKLNRLIEIIESAYYCKEEEVKSYNNERATYARILIFAL